MPRSKKAVQEQKAEDEVVENAKPENVASRALAHKSKKDVEEFLVGLKVGFANLAIEKLLNCYEKGIKEAGKDSSSRQHH